MNKNWRVIQKPGRLRIACFVAALAASQAASAQVTWTDWSSSAVFGFGTSGSATGTAGGVGVAYNGELLGNSQVNGAIGINYWSFSAPYLSATVPNAPPAAEILTLGGQNSAPFITSTVTFSQPVANPVMAILSLGAGTRPVRYDFAQDFTILSSGAGFWGGAEPDSLFEEPGDVLRGLEGHGTIRFNGTFTSLSWTTAPVEIWHGFQIGLLPIPEPEIYAMILAGLGLLGFAARRKRK